MSDRREWEFRSHFRAKAYGWGGSALAIKRLEEACHEILSVAETDPVAAAEGVVLLLGRIWPAFQSVDTSSGALPVTVNAVIEALAPLIERAPIGRGERQTLLERLWRAVEDDGVSYLWKVEDLWGALCAGKELASEWANRFLPKLRANWLDPDSHYMRGTALCLSCLLDAGRHDELFDTLALARHHSWTERRFGMLALLREGRTEAALAWAEKPTGLQQIAHHFDCEALLLKLGRWQEAYRKYALTANEANSNPATFHAIVQKYPLQDPQSILIDLAQTTSNPGEWFVTAVGAGYTRLALDFARRGYTSPRRLGRAARNLLAKDPEFAREAAWIAICTIFDGYIRQLTNPVVIEICDTYLAASGDRDALLGMAARHPRTKFGKLIATHFAKPKANSALTN